MSSTRRRRQKPTQTSPLPRPLSPDCYIDLTVDSPVRTPVQPDIIEYEAAPSTIPTWTIQAPLRVHNNENLSVGDLRRGSVELVSFYVGSNENNNLRENVSNETVVIDDTDLTPATSQKTSPKNLDESAASYLSCPICFEELLNTSITAYTTKCGHIFCEICLKKSIRTRRKCPMCLEPVTMKQCIRLHI